MKERNKKKRENCLNYFSSYCIEKIVFRICKDQALCETKATQTLLRVHRFYGRKDREDKGRDIEPLIFCDRL